MKARVYLYVLLPFVLAGICSAAIVPTFWDSLAHGESFAALGVLLFLIGAGIGASIVLLAVWLMSKRKTCDSSTAVTDNPKLSSAESKDCKSENGDSQNTHQEIQVLHVQATEHTTRTVTPIATPRSVGPLSAGIKPMSDTSLLHLLGLSLKGAMRHVSLRLSRWNSDPTNGEVFSPSQKAWEKGMNGDTIGAPTPRIYVLPPDSPVGGQGVQIMPTVHHSRSRSDIALSGRMGVPDVSILDIKGIPGDTDHEGGEESDGASCHSRSSSDLNSHEHDSDIESPSAALELPVIHPIDTQLGTFVQSLNPSDSKLTYMLSVMIEEVLPRPDSGLLKRMLRMSEIPIGRVEGSGEPILHLRVGSECHVSVGLIKLNGADTTPMDISGPHNIKLKPLDGEEVDLNATCEAVDNIEHVTSAIWDLKSHASPSLTQAANGDSSSTVLTPIEMTLVFYVHYPQQGDLIREIEVKKTFMASMRHELLSLDMDQRFVHDDAVLDFVLSKMELISMPSLLMFLDVEHKLQ